MPERTDGTRRIQCWSGPRNISTALMYSWRQRADTAVVDEPFYAHYLARSDRDHPSADLVLQSQPTDANRVIAETILGPCTTPVLYIKQMAHHLLGVDRSHLAHTENVLLVRHPKEMLASLSVQLPDCALSDTGLAETVELLEAVLDEGGAPIVIDSRVLRLDPRGTLESLCHKLGLDFDAAMLHWPAGPKPEDGAWAHEWYHNVHKSTGFAPYRPSTREFPERLHPVLDQALPLYERLLDFAIN